MPLCSPLPDESRVVDLEYGRIVNVPDDEIADDIRAWDRDVEEICREAELEDMATAYRGVEIDDDPSDDAGEDEDDAEEYLH
ncbi:hypothetical protein [Aureimonas sp. AU40]|uniref:hypothetical protein n=1 Tax=Aureimonas sp. AU40 TaxID=1637747 RepID=UPI0007860FB0|nr:hypothetical protein [Aureimonas sp. AU40]